MPFFAIAIKILSIIGIIFFLIFSYICLHWTHRDKRETKNIFSGVMVSFLYTFKVLLLGFLLLLLASFFLDKPF